MALVNILFNNYYNMYIKKKKRHTNKSYSIADLRLVYI